MGVEEDIQEFEEWAQNLGCSSKSLPPRKTLIRIFSSGKILAFNELMRRVRPQQEVMAIRDEVKVRKIERLGSKTVGVKRIQSEQLYLYESEKKLKERSEQLKTRLGNQKQQYDKLARSLKENNIQILQLKEEIANITAKNAICKLKTSDTKRQIEAEKEISKNIDEITPVKFTVSNTIEKKATDALIAVKAELQQFYSSFNHTENYEVNLAARQQLWQKLRESFAQIPNLVLWTSICEHLKQKQMSMERLSKMDMEKILYVDSGGDDPSSKNSLQIEIGKLYAKHIKLCIMRHGVNQKSKSKTNDYIVHYESFLHDTRAKFAMYNNQNIDDDFLGDYLSMYSTLHYGKGEIEYLLKIIDENELEIQRRKKSNEEYRIANMELSKIYDEIENLYIHTHEDLFNLAHVREKIQHSEELIRYLLQCKKEQASVLGTDGTTRLNNSVNSSFSSNNDSALNSSRSDSFNSTGLFARSETSVTRSMPASILPNHLNEIKTFLNIPIDKFKLRNPSRDHLDLCMSPLINPCILNQVPDDVKMLVVDYLLTPEMSIKRLRSQINWVKQMEAIGEFVSPDNLPKVDETKLTIKKNQQNDVLAQLTDETTAICANVHRTFKTIDRYLKFINENPLSKWVPKTETFNGKTYQEYEREFLMYYKMIQKPEGV